MEEFFFLDAAAERQEYGHANNYEKAEELGKAMFEMKKVSRFYFNTPYRAKQTKHQKNLVKTGSNQSWISK